MSQRLAHCEGAALPHEARLLVVGAGATIEECRRSGAKPEDPLPGISNFAHKLFNESPSLQTVTAWYLDTHGIQYDRTILAAYQTPFPEPVPIPPDAWARSPLRVFIELEREQPAAHNVEHLFQHVWQAFGDTGELWEALAYHGVYLYLFAAFIDQFGPADNVRPLRAGVAASERLYAGDRILNLNYDTGFDLALQQARKFFCFAPEHQSDAIVVYKPHGSFNLYCDRERGQCLFADPSRVPGSMVIRDPDGRTWSPASAIVPPRLDKAYAQHPTATRILETLARFSPLVVTLWGVGLTASDADLVDLYQTACSRARRVELINPSPTAYDRATELLGVPLARYPTLDEWLAATPL